MKIVYIAHPISGNVELNLKKIKITARAIAMKNPDCMPFAPYFFACHYLEDSEPDERKLGIKFNMECFERRMMDEVWLYGDKISLGMIEEIRAARKFGIPIIAMSEATKKMLPTV